MKIPLRKKVVTESFDGSLHQCAVINGDGFAPLHELVAVLDPRIVLVNLLLFPELKVIDFLLVPGFRNLGVEFFLDLFTLADEFVFVESPQSGVVHLYVKGKPEELPVWPLGVVAPQYFLVNF